MGDSEGAEPLEVSLGMYLGIALVKGWTRKI